MSYLFSCALLGVIELINSAILYRRPVVYPMHWVTIVVTVFEVVMVGWSWQVWRDGASGDVPSWLPASIMAYFIAMTVAGVGVALKHKDPEQPPVLPLHLIVLAGLFGLYLLSVSAWLWLA